MASPNYPTEYEMCGRAIQNSSFSCGRPVGHPGQHALAVSCICGWWYRDDSTFVHLYHREMVNVCPVHRQVARI